MVFSASGKHAYDASSPSISFWSLRTVCAFHQATPRKSTTPKATSAIHVTGWAILETASDER
jgi:hypothetical protein